MPYFDTHTHLTDDRYQDDREALLASLPERGLLYALDVACDIKDFPKTRALTASYPHIFGAYGVHPHYAAEVPENYLALVQNAIESDPKARALGEIGLDYYYDFAPKEAQKRIFSEQLDLAKAMHLPVILHVRDAFGDSMEILRQHRNGLFGVMHCFSGSAETAKECLELGLHIAFGGAVTFKNAKKPIEAAAVVPLDRLLLETDCPYMTPVPYRGKRNDPSFIPLIAEALAKVHGISEEELMCITADNAKKLFSIE